MSWLISRALMEDFENSHCLPGPAVESLADTCSDGAQSALSSGSHTPLAFCAPDKMTDFSRLSRFGTTFKPLTESLGEDLLMWFRAGFPAKTSALQEKAQASTASDQECGDTWPASLARFDPVSSSWKTAQRSLLADSGECSVTWPRSGMTADGRCWELPTLGRRIGGTDSGLLLPTPQSRDFRSGDAVDSPRAIRKRAQGWSPNLNDVVLWPTPHGFSPDGKSNGPSGNELGRAVNQSLRLATPTARDWKSGKASEATHSRNSRPLSEQIGGSLNPDWVELLMGWPKGWTSLGPMTGNQEHRGSPTECRPELIDSKPSATDKYQHALPQRGDC